MPAYSAADVEKMKLRRKQREEAVAKAKGRQAQRIAERR